MVLAQGIKLQSRRLSLWKASTPWQHCLHCVGHVNDNSVTTSTFLSLFTAKPSLEIQQTAAASVGADGVLLGNLSWFYWPFIHYYFHYQVITVNI